MTTKRKLTDEEAVAHFEDVENWNTTEGEWTPGPKIAAILDATAERRTADRKIEEAVRAARAGMIPWGAIAEALGVSRQAAMKKYKKLVEDATV